LSNTKKLSPATTFEFGAELLLSLTAIQKAKPALCTVKKDHG
jgi:hypothetical protein